MELQALFTAKEAVGFLYGPLMLLYTDFSISRKLHISPYDSIHTLPFLLYLFMRIFFRELFFINSYEFAVCALKNILIVLYLIFALIDLHFYRKEIKNYFANINKISFGWLFGILISAFIVSVLGTASLFISKVNRELSQVIDVIHYIILAVIIYITNYITLVKSEMNPIIKSFRPPQSEEAAYTKTGKQKYQKAYISDDKRKQFCAAIRNAVEEHKHYLNPDFSLVKLAAICGMSTNQVSQIINSEYNQNFYFFINNYRLEFAKKLIEENAESGSILSIAFRSGFNSKSVFNSFFKKKYGMTPSALRKIIQKNKIFIQ